MLFPRYLLFLLLSFTAITSYAGGLSAWSEKTPFNHIIEHDGTAGGWVSLYLDTTTVNFKNFYFYKTYLIAYDDSLQYIINEKTSTVQQFHNETAWKAALKEQSLEPIWKREYNSNYGTDKLAVIFFLIFVPFPLLLPIFWLVCIVSLALPSRKMWVFRKHFSWVYPAVILWALLSDWVPQSF
ncbi:hypothetical protein LX64_01307 [Chitinophaga skermanii]|uniref:PepSY-associated transmembrane protein n=1 Tax=Chitinophaga skermanii TaxID=331697 RepID=A0A327QYZ9_9BACT|nr:hypothetical protein [Chitinophaga skermanii]RAJ08653.1 hypothetical protein LX64_01307 [Chitinophaga skermanii]